MSHPSSLTITRPDDWHLHLRDGAALGYRFTVVSDAVYPAGSSYLKIFDDYGAVTPTAELLR